MLSVRSYGDDNDNKVHRKSYFWSTHNKCLHFLADSNLESSPGPRRKTRVSIFCSLRAMVITDKGDFSELWFRENEQHQVLGLANYSMSSICHTATFEGHKLCSWCWTTVHYLKWAHIPARTATDIINPRQQNELHNPNLPCLNRAWYGVRI